MNRNVDEILKRSYSWVVKPAEEGGYTAEILEFPGCVTQGETLEETYANLEDAARGWIETVIELGQDVPEPTTENEYSGKVVLRLGHALHRSAAMLAERDGVSLNAFLVTAIAERVGAVARPTVLTVQTQGTSDELSAPRVRRVRYDPMNQALYLPPKTGRRLPTGSVRSRPARKR